MIAVASSVMLTGCGSSRTVTARVDAPVKPTQSVDRPVKAESVSPQAGALLAEAKSWLGTPYKYGGEDRDGVDCSGLVLRVYKDALGIPLPRNSREQKDYCGSIERDKLMPGDLVFFSGDRDRKKVSHVGIYVGDNNMIHASSSQGVIISDITTPYYERTFVGAGFVEKYHAMIPPEDINTVEPEQPQSAFTLTPVENIPSKKANTSYPAVVTKAKEEPAQTVAEPTPDQARAAVLGALKEKTLK